MSWELDSGCVRGSITRRPALCNGDRLGMGHSERGRLGVRPAGHVLAAPIVRHPPTFGEQGSEHAGSRFVVGGGPRQVLHRGNQSPSI